MQKEATKSIDLTKFDFPTLSGLDMAFSTIKTDPKLLSEAKLRGFYRGNTPYNRLFSNLFFGGGRVTRQKGVDDEFYKKAWAYCRSFMGSFEPRHEEKEAICAMIMSELVEPI